MEQSDLDVEISWHMLSDMFAIDKKYEYMMKPNYSMGTELELANKRDKEMLAKYYELMGDKSITDESKRIFITMFKGQYPWMEALMP